MNKDDCCGAVFCDTIRYATSPSSIRVPFSIYLPVIHIEVHHHHLAKRLESDYHHNDLSKAKEHTPPNDADAAH